MFRQGLKGIGRKKWVIAFACSKKAAHQLVELLLVYLLLCALRNNTTGTNIIKVIKILRCIALYLIGINRIKRIDRLLLQSYIIIISRVYNGILAFGIQQQPLVALGKLVALFVNASHSTVGHLTILVESAVVGTALAQTHLLNVSYQVLQLVIGCFDNLV